MPGGRRARSPREGRARLSLVTPCTTKEGPKFFNGFVKYVRNQNSSKALLAPLCVQLMGSPVLGTPSRLIVTVARRGFGTQAQGPIRDSFVLGSAHRAHTSRHAIPVEEPAAHNVAPGVRLWSRSKKLWQVQEVPTHTANVENLVTVAQNLPNTSQPSRLARGRLSRAWSPATWSEVVHTK